MDLSVDQVHVPAPQAGSGEVSGVDEVSHDSLDRSLGDPHPVGDVTYPDLRVLGDGQQDEAVTRDERPRDIRWTRAPTLAADGRILLSASSRKANLGDPGVEAFPGLQGPLVLRSRPPPPPSGRPLWARTLVRATAPLQEPGPLAAQDELGSAARAHEELGLAAVFDRPPAQGTGRHR